MNTKHLKAKILDLAIRGKLVPQDSSEGNAAELLQKIRDEKGGESLPLATAGKPSSATPSAGSNAARNARSKNASFIIKADDGKHYEQFADGSLKNIEDEIPFEIPENWCWCRLKEIAYKITDGEHNTPKRVNTFQGFYLLSARNIQNGNLSLNDVDYVDEQEFNRIFARCNPKKNDVLISCSGSVGRCARIEDDNKYVMVRSAAMISAPSINTKYLMYTIQSPELQNQIQYASKQTAQANLFQGAISNLVLPLPPLSEQQRIVSVIEKAFEQIDIIEKNKLNLKTYIKQTKSKVLDLAIHGKLVEQNLQEGNAFELLEKIRNEKAELVKQKKLKEDKNASFIIKADDGKHYEQFADGSLKDVEEEIPFQIPENWCWCRLTSICDYGKCKNAAPSELLPDSWILDLEDIEKGTGKIKKFVNFSERNSLSTKHVFTQGSILYSKLRPYLNKVVIAPKDGFCTSEILPLDFNGVYINNFAQRLLMSPYFLSTVNMLTYGVKMPRLGTGEANQLLLPLPPLSEQKRIVAKIEHVFEQLDVLEKSMGE